MSLYWDAPDGTRYYPGDDIPGIGVWDDRTMADEFPEREPGGLADTGPSIDWARLGLGGAWAWASARSRWHAQQRDWQLKFANQWAKKTTYGERKAAAARRRWDRREWKRKYYNTRRYAPYHVKYAGAGTFNVTKNYNPRTGRHRKPWHYRRHSVIGWYNTYNY